MLDNSFTLTLPAGLDAELDWEALRLSALEHQKQGLFWVFDFGRLDPHFFTPGLLAVEHFSKTLGKEFFSSTRGVCFYQGALPFWGETPMESATVFGEVMHRFAAFLPDEMTAFCCLDLSSFSSSAEMAQLFSEARFAYVELALRGAPSFLGKYTWASPEKIVTKPICTAQLGICLPQDDLWNEELALDLQKCFEKQTHSFRILPEPLITERWDGLDQIIALEKGLTPQGRRMLKGLKRRVG